MSDHGGDDRDGPWHPHGEFVRHYEPFLEAAYDAVHPPLAGKGRQRLVEQLRVELRRRGARTVLDCSAGTGFPALHLARRPPTPSFEIHCTDGDPAMLKVLVDRARSMGLPLADLVPPGRRPQAGAQLGPEHLRLDWQELDAIDASYDYVMCRGNSLAYDRSWAGETDVATESQIARHLHQMADRVRPGGWLHVDAPWHPGLGSRTYEGTRYDLARIHEQVTPRRNHRRWRVTFHHRNANVYRFLRHSSLLTVGDLKRILEDLGFTHTAPFELPHERESYGVIIARKPD